MPVVAAIYDIHGNLPALEAVLQEIHEARVDQMVVGGDVVPGPMPRETIERLLALDIPVHFIAGNGDREVLASIRGTGSARIPAQYREVMRWNAEQLHDNYEGVIAGWPSNVRLSMKGIGDVLFCHATPRNDTEIFTRRTPEETLLKVFAGVDAPLVICGHTHMQFDRTIGGVRVVNAGSVGMSFEGPGAFWLLLGPDIELRRTAYDYESAAARIRATAYPEAEDFASRNVLQPPSAESTLDLFARVELQ